MGWEASNVVSFGLGPLLQGQTILANLIIGPRILGCETNVRKSWAGKFHQIWPWGPSFKVKQW